MSEHRPPEYVPGVSVRAINGGGQFCKDLLINNKQGTFSVTGDFAATWRLQRILNDAPPGFEWADVSIYTGPASANFPSIGPFRWRIGVLAGQYNSGTLNVALAG